MTLADMLEQLDSLDDDLTIYAQQSPEWRADSPAVVATEPEDGGLPSEAAGMEYFLEVHLAKEVLEVWSEWRNGRAPTLQERCEAVIHYAIHDAYLPVQPDSTTTL